MSCKDLPKDVQDNLSSLQKNEINFALRNNTPIIVKGEKPTTGKTRLVKALKDIGASVYEPFEVIEVEFK